MANQPLKTSRIGLTLLAGAFISAPVHGNKVSYPKVVALDFLVFKEKCSTCHTLKMAIETEEILPSEVSGLIDRMAAVDDANISSSEKSRIYHFMVYDMAHRRKTELDAALGALPASEQKTERTRLNQVLEAYEKATSMETKAK